MSKLLHNGHFLLPSGSYATSILLDNRGLIVSINSESAESERIDMRGMWVIPAFEDAHNHLAARARTIFELDLRGLDLTWDEARDRIAERTKNAAIGAWIVCHGWNEARWEQLEQADLDAISTKHGILLINISYHGALINRVGTGMLSSRGFPTGEHGKITETDFEAVTIATSPTVEQYADAIPKLQERLMVLGIGALHDMHILTLEQLEAFHVLESGRKLTIPLTLYINPRLLTESAKIKAYRERSGDMAQLVGLKLFLDGAIGTSTAAVCEPYADGTGSGVLRYTDEECKKIITQAASLGLTHVAMHCIGDRAINQACRVLMTLKDVLPQITTWRFEHFEMPNKEAISVLAEHGGIASVQPNFSWDVDNYAGRLAENAQRINPLRTLLDSDVPVAFGSDVAPSGPLIGIRWATVNAPIQAERITLPEAIRCYTEIPASIAGYGNMRGKIVVGYEANFTTLSANPLLESSWKNEASLNVRELWRKGTKVFSA